MPATKLCSYLVPLVTTGGAFLEFSDAAAQRHTAPVHLGAHVAGGGGEMGQRHSHVSGDNANKKRTWLMYVNVG